MLREWRQRRLRNRLTAEIVTWLDAPDSDRVVETIKGWDQIVWQVMESVAVIQGIGPYLHDTLPGTPIYPALPDSFRQRLASEYTMNAARVERLHEDLSGILQAANRAGIAVMPLKGSILSTHYYASPALRPMADLDLLIHPKDEPELVAILEKRGYQISPAGQKRHRKFINPDGDTVAKSGECPDNPRPVEIHTKLLERILWDTRTVHDFTAFIWSESQETEFLGARVWVPTPEGLVVHLATHMLHHLLAYTGRAIQLIDLALIAPSVRHLDPPDANWIYPSLLLACRALPNSFTDVDLSPLTQRTWHRLRRWATSVPLDGRCGLNLNLVQQRSRWRMRWVRWYPTLLRLALAYGDVPLPVAYGQHVMAMLGRLWRLVSES